MRNLEGERRVVVTGMGMVSGLGHNVEQNWQKVLTPGVSGISEVEIENCDSTVAGAIVDFDSSNYVGHLSIPSEDKRILYSRYKSRMARVQELALVAAYEAFRQSGLITEDGMLDPSVDDASLLGVIMGTGIGGSQHTIEVHEDLFHSEKHRTRPTKILQALPDRVASVITMAFGLGGPSGTVNKACASGQGALNDALDKIRLGRAMVMAAGGAESVMVPAGFGFFESAGTLTDIRDPQTASRPFSKSRRGFVMAEGAGVLILEDEEFALRRGAKPLAWFVGGDDRSDKYHDSLPHPEGEGTLNAIAATMEGNEHLIFDYDAMIVNAHGPGTIAGDITEPVVIRKAFLKGEVDGDDRIPKSKKVFVSSTKGKTGHSLGASGGIEAVVTVKSIIEGVNPPTENLTDPIDEMKGLEFSPSEVQDVEAGVAMNQSNGFGGYCSVGAYAKWEPRHREI